MIPKRLKAARLRAQLTQERLGVLAGIEEATAYSRLSHYEHGTHKPTFELVCGFAHVLGVPECYFYNVTAIPCSSIPSLSGLPVQLIVKATLSVLVMVYSALPCPKPLLHILGIARAGDASKQSDADKTYCRMIIYSSLFSTILILKAPDSRDDVSNSLSFGIAH